MVYSIAAKSGERPRWHQLEHAIKRNFGGLIEGEPVEIFKRHYPETDVSFQVFQVSFIYSKQFKFLLGWLANSEKLIVASQTEHGII